MSARRDLATPLSQVTFVVLDLETTGGSPSACAITEVGALRFVGGECTGTFHTMVNPGVRLPPSIVYLTGITEAMVAPAPLIESVLPAFVEFIGDAVIVGHNVRFDSAFLRANLARLQYRPLRNPTIDTCALARRLLHDEVPDCTLATLARHVGTSVAPCHRAFDDAAATAELLHYLLERAGTIGVTALDDLLALPVTAAHPQASKLRWVGELPRRPGVYLFRDGTGRLLYVGRAADLRQRVRSYFASRDRRRIGPLLREAQAFEHVVCADDLEAAVLQARLIDAHRPRYNLETSAAVQRRYLRFGSGRGRQARWAKPVVVRERRTDGDCYYVGPFPSPASARAAQAEAAAEGVDRGPDSLTRVWRRQHRTEALVAAGRLVIDVGAGRTIVVDRGRLEGAPPDPTTPSRPAGIDEVTLLASWLEARSDRCRLVFAEHGWAVPIARPGARSVTDPRGDAAAVA